MVVWLSNYCRPAPELKVKTKNPPPFGGGFFGQIRMNASKPGRRAGKQRALKQQVQIEIHIHGFKLILSTGPVK
ncbi:MAG: hypothetical protein P4N60_19005 [Verrucomicrobiae bacterium]|nr:hypothetical protein [Verrucomicrobiae bacterium]